MLNKNQKFAQQFRHLLSTIKRCYDQNKSQIIFKTRLNNNLILGKLQALGYIQSYQFFKDFYLIKLKPLKTEGNNTQVIKSLSFKKAMTPKGFISVNQQKLNQRREGGVTINFLTTDRGVLTSHEILEKNIGGKLLFIIK
jgi:ribosomal protein S8